EDKLLKWLDQFNGERNIYWHVNRCTRPLSKKAEKEDIKDVLMLHVDLDPRPGEDPAEERERAIKMLKEYNPPASVIIDSGGGIQGFWFLEEPIEINGR